MSEEALVRVGVLRTNVRGAIVRLPTSRSNKFRPRGIPTTTTVLISADLYPKTLYNQATAYTNERQLYEKFYYPAVYDGTCLFTNCEIGHSLVNTVRRSLYTVTIGQPCNGIVNINLLNLNRNVRTLNSMPRRLSMPVNTTSLGVVTV